MSGSVNRANASFNMSFNQHNNTRDMSYTSAMSFSRTKTRGGETTMMTSTGMTHSIEPYGVPLPAMVKVALTSQTAESQAQNQCSCRLDPNGWAWLVSGRKLYIWRHSLETTNKKNSIACRELVLPPSELVHNAQLVSVVTTGSASSCIAVSPEGHITYWNNISNESSTVTFSADVPGQECDTLTSLWPVGCILTTTSGTVLLVKALIGRGNKPTLSCVPLGVQKSWLGGWSKKVSTMLFTSMPAASSGLDNKRVRVVVPISKEDDPSQPAFNKDGKVYILLGTLIQTWQINSEAGLISLAEVNIDDTLRKEFFDNVWGVDNEDRGDVRGIQAWALDATYNSNTKQLAVLAAAKSQYETTDNLVYGISLFEMKNIRRRDTWQFIPVSCEMGNTGTEDEQFHSWRLFATQNFYYVVSNSVVLTASDKPDVPVDSIESKLLGDSVIGAGLVYGPIVVILVPKHGLLTVKPLNGGSDGLFLDETFSEIRVPDHLAFSITQVNFTDDTTSEENLTRYKSAFLLFLQKKQEESMQILEGLFPSNVLSMAPHDPLDISTVALCEKLMDEAPVADPRWAASYGRRGDDQDPLGMRSKILIKNFLIDKKEGLELYFGFLNNIGIGQKLQGVVVKQDIVSTKSLLYNCYEKVCFALALQTMQLDTQFRKAIDTAIKSIVMMRSQKDVQVRSSQLNSNDVFYKDVSRIHQIIPALISIQEDNFNDLATKEVPERILQTNEIILRAVLEITNSQPGDKLGQIHDLLIKPVMTNERNQYEVLPWLVQNSVLPSLLNQHKITIDSGIKNSDVEAGLKANLAKQLQQYTDLILSGIKLNVESIDGTERYEQKLNTFETIRAKLLRSHLEVDDYDGASFLAEKYLDFEILVTVCYNKDDRQRLEMYFEKYEDMSFPEYSFEWYVNQAKTAELVETFSRSKFSPKLKNFLKQYPQIAWHYSAVIEDYGDAENLLLQLSEVDKGYVDDKKFYLCMAKLASFAKEESFVDIKEVKEFSPVIKRIDNALELVDYQNQLPDDVLAAVGLDRETMRVLTAEELINMYTTHDVEFELENYWNAFCLVSFMSNEELGKEKRLVILSRIITRDAWDWETDHPLDVIATTGLHQFVSFALEQGVTLDDAYPLQELASFELLRNFMESTTTKFLLRACHEHFSAMIEDNIMETNWADVVSHVGLGTHVNHVISLPYESARQHSVT